MRITNRFTIAVHIIAGIAYFDGEELQTSGMLAGSINANPVVVRTVLSKLKSAGIVHTQQGVSGASLNRPLQEISFFDICQAIDGIDEGGIFSIHKDPNPDCPVGRSIHGALAGSLHRVQTAMEEEMKAITMDKVVDHIGQHQDDRA